MLRSCVAVSWGDTYIAVACRGAGSPAVTLHCCDIYLCLEATPQVECDPNQPLMTFAHFHCEININVGVVSCLLDTNVWRVMASTS